MLDKELEKYSLQDIYPFHMPGHKRVSMAEVDPYKIDITEIPGFDDLHSASGIIAELQRGYAELYGAEDAFISVNGSTLGNLAAVFAATKNGEGILVADGCHKSIIHAMELRDLIPHFIEPEIVDTDTRLYENGYSGSVAQQKLPDTYSGIKGVSGCISAVDVEAAISEYPDARLVVVTSPTYEGMISDVDGIVRVAHEHDVAVHIDGAHGAHFGLGGLWDRSLISSGADTVVLSLHKALPAFTGSSVLLRSKDSRISKDAIDYYIDCFETSSPSYILMYGMAVCLRYLQESGPELFVRYGRRLTDFYESVSGLKKISVDTDPKRDKSKIVIRGMGYMTGAEIAETLRRDYRIETELTASDHCLALSSVMDDTMAFDRLADALKRIDSSIEYSERIK